MMAVDLWMRRAPTYPLNRRNRDRRAGRCERPAARYGQGCVFGLVTPALLVPRLPSTPLWVPVSM